MRSDQLTGHDFKILLSTFRQHLLLYSVQYCIRVFIKMTMKFSCFVEISTLNLSSFLNSRSLEKKDFKAIQNLIIFSLWRRSFWACCWVSSVYFGWWWQVNCSVIPQRLKQAFTKHKQRGHYRKCTSSLAGSTLWRHSFLFTQSDFGYCQRLQCSYRSKVLFLLPLMNTTSNL